MNRRLFEKLCGSRALPNAVLCTTMWDTTPKQAAEACEVELCDVFWKEMITQGSTVVRHNNTKDSAFAIVRKLIQREPVIVELQRELADKVPLENTGAGLTVVDRINELKKMYETEMAGLRHELERMQHSNEPAEAQARDALEKEIEFERQKVAKLEEELAYLRAPRDALRARARARLIRKFRTRLFGDKKCSVM